MKFVGLLGFITFLVFNAYGEEGEKVERIKVTGSHIKRIDQEGTSPVTVIDQEQLKFSGSNSLADVVRNLSFASFGVSRKLNLQDGNGGSVTSVRGLPVSEDGVTGYILILLNGRRFASQDLNLIPMSIVDRVEIIKDGASAVYGSDAIGGVMNFITKKDYTGKSFSIGASLPEPFVLPKKYLKYQGWRSERWKDIPKFKDKVFGLKGGEDLSADYTEGWSGDNYNSLFNISFKTQRDINMQDRPFTMLDVSDLSNWSKIGSPGSYKLGENGVFQPMPGCPKEGVYDESAGDVKHTFCNYNYALLMGMTPIVHTLGLFFTNTMDLDNSDLYTHAVYSYENSSGKLAPPPESSISKEKIEKVKEGLWDPWVAALAQEHSGLGLENLNAFHYRLAGYKDLEDKGRRIQVTHKHLFDLQAGLETYLSDTWSLSTSLGGSGYFELGRNKNYFIFEKLFELDESGKAKWSPFRTEKDNVSYALHTPETDSKYVLGVAEISADGELFSLGSLGVLSSALGTRVGYEHLKSSGDEITYSPNPTNPLEGVSKLWGGASFPIREGNRYWGSSYIELLAPLEFSSNNSLELQLAGSADYYQYTDKPTINPKIGAKWKLADMFQVKASWGKGFKAPNMASVFSNQIKDHPFALNYLDCTEDRKEDCLKEKRSNGDYFLTSSQRSATYYGNKNLKPETADVYNVGLSLEPSQNLFLSLDFFSNHVRDRIQAPDLSDITEMVRYHAEGSKNFQKERDIEIKIEDKGGALEVESPYYNFGDYKNKGLEGTLRINYPVMDHVAFFNVDSLYFLSTEISRPVLDEEKGDDGKTKKIWRNRLGAFGFPTYKIQTDLGFKYKNGLVWSLSSRWISSFNASPRDDIIIPETPLEKGVRWVKTNILKREIEERDVKAVYDENEAKKDYNSVLQALMHVDFDLTIQLPLSVISSEFGQRSSLLFKVENILNTAPPEVALNSENISGVQTGACGKSICNFASINGRTWRVNYTREF